MINKETVYGAFVDYYGDLTVQLIKNDNGWLVYAARINSGLNQYRYIFVIVHERQGRGSNTTLDQLDWICFQTRNTDELYHVPLHNLYLDNDKKEKLNDIINVLERTKDETIYVTDELPIKIKLLHDPRKKNHLQYPDTARLYQALETYNCVIELL